MPGQSKPFCLGRETENKFESVLDHFKFYTWTHDSYPFSRMIVTMMLMMSPQQSHHYGVSSPYAHLSKGYHFLSDPFQAKNKSYPEPPPCRHASQRFLQTLPLSAPTVGIVMRVWSLLLQVTRVSVFRPTLVPEGLSLEHKSFPDPKVSETPLLWTLQYPASPSVQKPVTMYLTS